MWRTSTGHHLVLSLVWFTPRTLLWLTRCQVINITPQTTHNTIIIRERVAAR